MLWIKKSFNHFNACHVGVQCERKVPTGPLEERPQDHGAGVPGALPRYKGKTDFFM